MKSILQFRERLKLNPRRRSKVHETAVWLKLKEFAPPKLKRTCELCYDYFDFNNFLNTEPNILGRDIAKIQSLIYQIVTEYVKCLRLSGDVADPKEPKKMEKIENDIHKVLSVFYTEKGTPKNLADTFASAYTNKTLNNLFPLWVAPFDSFINSKILESLKESRILSQKVLLNKFCRSSFEEAIEHPLTIEKYCGKKRYETDVWLDLEMKVPKELVVLCELCYKFFDYNNFLNFTVYPSLTEQDVSKVGDVVYKLVEEYIKCLKNCEEIDEVEKIEEDIHKVLSVFPKEGIKKPLTVSFTYERDDPEFKMFTASLSTFIHSNILNPLKESYEHSQENWLTGYYSITLNKSVEMPPEKKEGVVKKNSMNEVEEME